MKREKILVWSEIVEGHVRADVVVEVLVVGEGGRGLADGEFAAVGVPELGACGGVAALDAAVEFEGPWRQDEEWEVDVTAGGVEIGHEFGAAVDLDEFAGGRGLHAGAPALCVAAGEVAG